MSGMLTQLKYNLFLEAFPTHTGPLPSKPTVDISTQLASLSIFSFLTVMGILLNSKVGTRMHRWFENLKCHMQRPKRLIHPTPHSLEGRAENHQETNCHVAVWHQNWE